MLTARKLVQKILYDVEMSLRGILRGFALKVGKTTPVQFEGRTPVSPVSVRRSRSAPHHRRAALVANGVSELAARDTAGSGRGP
jgi:hypothetical protein